MAHDGRKRAMAAAAAMLAAGESVRATAAAVKVGERTIHRWNRDPKFKRRVDRLRRQMIGAAAGKLADGLGAASDTLKALLADPDSGVKLKAAVKVMEMALKLREFAELERRVKELEKAADGGRP